MKTGPRKNSSATIPASRWLAYATAGAATALAGATAADAEIHYSGRVGVKFEPDSNKSVRFPLDQAGDSMTFGHRTFIGDRAFLRVNGLRSAGFIGRSSIEYAFVYRLKGLSSRYISEGPFVRFYDYGILFARGFECCAKWEEAGTGFVGFQFNNGAGIQYGWVRVRMGGEARNWGFVVVDYAYADPGEPISPGQTSSSSKIAVTKEGSLGLLALGGAGLTLWRQRRKRTSV